MRSFYRSLRIISAVTLFFFVWSFLPLYSLVAYAAEPTRMRNADFGMRNEKPEPATAGDRFEKALDAIRENISKAGEKLALSGAEGAGEDDTREWDIIKAKRAEIESADGEFKKEFSATEKKLKDAKLPKEILDRHYRFVKHYEDNLKELRANLDGVEQAKTKSDRRAKIEKARLHLEKVKAPSKHQKLDPNNLPFRARKAGKTREPRLKQEEFERDFPSRKKTRTAFDPKDLLAADSRRSTQILVSGFKSAVYNKPILVASNGSLAGILSSNNQFPRTAGNNLPLPSVGEGWGEGAIPNSAFAISQWDTPDFLLAQATVGLPIAADLVETPEVQLTQNIKDLAAQLNHNPVKIYEWVKINIEFVPTYGSIQGADMCLQTKQCNSFDTSSLLIALLRSCSIPAHYVYGTVEIPIDRIMNWIGGFTDPKAALTLIASGGIPVAAKVSGGKIVAARLETVWTEAWVDMIPSFGAKHKEGDSWVPLDPSFKEHDITSAVNLSNEVQFNESVYLGTQNNIPPSLAYFFMVEDYHTANYQNTLNEVMYGKAIKAEEFEIFLGTLPYKVLLIGQRMYELPDAARHKISFNLAGLAASDAATVQKNIAEIAGKKITVSYNPASQQDAATIENYGGLLKTPSYLLKVTPVIKVDEKVILEGSAINPGSSMKLNIHFISPGQSTDTIETDLAGGIYYTIGLSASDAAKNLMPDRLDNLKNLRGTVYNSINAGDGQIGELLHNISMQYFGQVNGASKALESQMHIYCPKGISAGFVFVKTSYLHVFGVPSSPPVVSSLMMDIQRYVQSPFSITGDLEQEREFTKIQGLNTSFYEHAVIENLMNIETVSAVKALQIANESGIPIYSITDVNINEILPLLTVSQEVKNDIQNSVNAGKEVTISKDNILLNEWSGVGYIVRNPATGEGAYMISLGLSGSGTTQPIGGALMLLARSLAALAAGKQISVLAHLVDHFFDEFYMTRVGQMLQGRGYIPKYKDTFSKQTFLEHFNRNDNWLAYFSGHGCIPGHDYVVPGYDAQGDAEFIYPSDVQNADTHIAFLNTCNNGGLSGFMGSFGIDQRHEGKPRDEVFISWKGSVDWIESSRVGYQWWRYMTEGKTAQEAGDALGTNSEYTHPASQDAPQLIITGKPETKLY